MAFHIPTRIKLAYFLFVWLCLSICMARAQDNILFIVADDIGAESLNSYAGDNQAPPIAVRPQTPTLDKLAKTPGRSVRFTNCWADPMCSPSRACFLTGEFAFRTGVKFAGFPFDGPQYSIAQAMKQAGYRTAAFGKWHLNPKEPGEDGNPIVLGFDRFEGYNGGACFCSQNETYFSWTKRIETPTSLETVRVENYAPIEVVNNASTWINQQNGDPWFVYLAFHTVHAPWHVPPLELHSYGNVNGNQGKYAAMIQAMDTVIGNLIEEIDLSKTTIIFVGDNGNARTVSPFWGPDDRAKRTPYQGGVHVPCFVYRSGRTRRVSRLPVTSDALVHAVDFYDTIIELTGNDPDLLGPKGAATDSRSFAPFVFNPNRPMRNRRRFNYTQLYPDTNSHFRNAIRDDQFILIQPGDGLPEQFYDLLTDPLELFDLMPNLTKIQSARLKTLTIERQRLWDSED